MKDIKVFAKNNLGYVFNNFELLSLALSHKSVGPRNNERLEFLGDSILSYIISEALFESFPKADEGQLTRMRAHLVCKDGLAAVAKSIGIQEQVILSSSEYKTGGHQRASILADALEAIIAAIHRDSCIDITKDVVKKWFSSFIDDLKSSIKKDPKTQLQEYLQSMGQSLPIYEIVDVSGPAHKQTFHVECKVPDNGITFFGVAESRRKAEQSAAKLAYEQLKESKNKNGK
jgi:ribonuclease-3